MCSPRRLRVPPWSTRYPWKLIRRRNPHPRRHPWKQVRIGFHVGPVSTITSCALAGTRGNLVLVVCGMSTHVSTATCCNPVSTVNSDTGFHGYPIRYPWKRIYPPGRRRNLAQVSTSTFAIDFWEQVSTCTGCALAGIRRNVSTCFHVFYLDRFPR